MLDTESRIQALKSLPKGSKIHILGLCGTGVGAVAIMLKDLGFQITGSDAAYYPPMDIVVKGVADEWFEGYSADNLKTKPDFVIVGNSIRKDNPEMEAVDVPFASMPEALGALLIGDKKCSIVVGGTHGKTTTTTAISYLLEKNGLNPGYFIGGVPQELDSQIKVGGDDFAVLEGDEYDSAWFAKYAKFQSYRPDIFVITSLEFDHADIYRNIEEIEEQFRLAVSKMKQGSKLVVCGDYPRLGKQASEWSKNYGVELITYGSDSDNNIFIKERAYENGYQLIKLSDGTQLKTKLSGDYNALNMLATYVVGKEVGAPDFKVLENFSGAKRRQEFLIENEKIVLVEDFAHHPTAVKGALLGLKERFPNHKLVAVFEPRSNTSRRSFFQKEYADALGVADFSLIKRPLPLGYSKFAEEESELDVEKIAKEISGLVFETNQEVISAVKQKLANGRWIVALMSNGDFGGLPKELKKEIS